MTCFFVRRGDEQLGPMTATELRSARVRPDDLIRADEDGQWLSFSELVARDQEARLAIEDAVDPDEPVPEPWQTRRLIEFSWAAFLLAADAFWILNAASMHGSLASWANAFTLVTAMGVGAVGILIRRPWAWPLSAMCTTTMAAWMLAPLIASGGEVRFGVWFLANLAATVFLFLRKPRGAALDWPPHLRRLVLLFSTDPNTEGRLPARRANLTIKPLSALAGTVAFFVIVLGGVFLYHQLRFPDNDLPITMIPRGGDGWARAGAASVYGLMVVLAAALAFHAGKARPALGLVRAAGARRALMTGARLFLVLFLILLSGRWLLRSVEALEGQVASARGDDPDIGEPTATAQVRGAVQRAVGRSASARPSWWALVVALLVGPVCEEIFFRGLIFGALRKRWSFWIAAVVSSVVFSLAHGLGGHWGGAAPVLLMEVAAGGMIAAYAYERHGSLLAPISVHVLWNLAQTVTGLVPTS